MTNLPLELSQRHGQSPAYWRLALMRANIRVHVSEPQLHPHERKSLTQLLAQTRPAAPPQPEAAPPQAPPLALGGADAALVTWVREHLYAYLQRWEPRRLRLSPSASRPLAESQLSPTPEPSQAFLKRLAYPYEQLAPPLQRLALLLYARECHPVLARIFQGLLPSNAGQGLPLRLALRVLSVGSGLESQLHALPPALFGLYSSYGLDWVYLKSAQTAVNPAQPNPTRLRQRHGQITLDAEAIASPDSTLPFELEHILDYPRPSLANTQIALDTRTLDGLQSALDRWRYRHEVARAGHDLGEGGLVVLFAGEDDQGQLPTALTLCQSLGLKLVRVNAAQLLSRYVGESSQRLAALFDHIEASHEVLYLEGADALYASRQSLNSESDSNSLQRESNQLINYTLSRLDRFKGLALLRAESLVTLDAALQRRIAITIPFLMPSERLRQQQASHLWQQLSPHLSLPLGADLRLIKALARHAMPLEELSRRASDLAFLLAHDLLTLEQVDTWLAQKARTLS